MSSKIITLDIMDGLKLASPYPAAYLSKSLALIVSDTHLGIEAKLASRGISIPSSVFRETLDSVLIPARELGCKYVYILGDLKHEYGRPKESDWWAIRKFVNELRSIGAEPVLVRGNHDRYLTIMLRELGVAWHDEYVFLDGFLLTHGHKKIKIKSNKKFRGIKAVILGHEHPAISIPMEFGGRKERFKAFIFVPSEVKKSKGDEGKPPLLVLPSVNPLAYGTEVNETSTADFLSPYLKNNKSLEHAKPYLLEVGELTLLFPDLSVLGKLIN